MANLSDNIVFPQGGSSWKTIQGKINWEETEIDSSSSPVRSKVHTKIYAKCGTGGTTGKGWNGYVQVGSNSKHSFSSLSSSTTISSSYVLLKEYDDWVEHEADGSKTVTIKGKVAGPSGTSLEGVSSSGSGDATLTNVPQASTITSVSNGTTPYSPTIVWTPASTSFKYKVEYKYTSGSSTWSVLSDLISPATTSSYSYNSLQISSNIFGLSPNSPTLTATAVLYTYNSDGTTQVGNASTKTFTVTLNSSIKPSLSISNLAEADSGMIAKNWGVFVQGKSKLSFHLGWSYPSPIPASSTLTATTNGQTFTTTSMGGSADYTTSALSSSGSKSVSASITDSRGRTTTASASYTVYAYSKPSITNAVVERCLQNGTLSDTGTYLKYSFASTISSCNGHNTATYQLGYRVKGSNNAYTYVNISNNATNVVLSGVTFSASSSYDIQFRVTDAFNEVVWEDESIGSGFRLVHYNKSKKALALGKSSEATGDNKLLEVALPTTISENVSSTKDITSSSFQGRPWNFDTANTTDTWVPVASGGEWKHRAIPADYNDAPSTLTVSRAYEADRLRSMANVTSGNTANRPWHLIMKTNSLGAAWRDTEAIILIRSYYSEGPTGILKVALRGNNTGNPTASIQWLTRYGFGVNDVCLGLYNGSSGVNYYADVYVKRGTYARCEVATLRYDGTWQFVNSSEGDNGSSYSNVYASVGTTGMSRNYSSIIYPTDIIQTQINNSLPSIISGSISLTNTSGSNGTLDYVIYGKVLFAELSFTTKNSSTAVGSDCYQGTIGNAAYRPTRHSAELCGYYDSTALICTISTSGGISVRATGASIAASKSANVRGTYIIP